MDKSIAARSNAFQQVQINLSNNQAKFAHIPAMGKMFTSLTSLIGETNELIDKAENIPSKTSGNKNLVRSALSSVALKASNILKVYSFISKEENLSNFVDSINNSFLTKLREKELLSFAKTCSKELHLLKPNLPIMA
ncbi:hypothetical protein [Marinifilum fragile]|uniref:hypothetical protein n=1 Tax=Marinifilum fragile TaxID=570161 RepID=UPI0006CF8DAB|nr:hypothetical protein [Marinifilum fragile]